METKFTPGPWSYSTSSNGWSYTINIHQADNAKYTPDWSDVAFCTCEGERQQIQEANARLISAAPELLEIADEYALHFDNTAVARAEFGDAAVDREMRRRSVIAKATGGESCG